MPHEMARVLFNARASTAGGGLTYLRNVLPRLRAIGGGHSFVVAVHDSYFNEFAGFESDQLKVTPVVDRGIRSRLWQEQAVLRALIATEKIDVLISLGNFALFRSPVPQLLFNRNDLYFSSDFIRDLSSRGLYLQKAGTLLKRAIAKASVRAADVNVTPTRAFAEKLADYNGGDPDGFEVLRFGFDRAKFGESSGPLDPSQTAALRIGERVRRILHVSHYNYFRNFETLIRALPLIDEMLQARTGENALLVLTTDIRQGKVYGGYDTTLASELIDRLRVRDRIAMLGEVPYDRLAELYRQADLFVCPSYSESFGHPMLEAMSSGVPVVAANLPVHREICGEAALYFDTFDEATLARECVRVLTDQNLAEKLRTRGEVEIRRFSWDDHVTRLMEIIERLKR
jgi:glycosyltransferase involved in cell wall biosynthesis